MRYPDSVAFASAPAEGAIQETVSAPSPATAERVGTAPETLLEAACKYAQSPMQSPAPLLLDAEVQFVVIAATRISYITPSFAPMVRDVSVVSDALSSHVLDPSSRNCNL